jgi:hypothetical protein
MSPRRCSVLAALVTPARRTPSISAMNSWVKRKSSVATRSRVINSQRASRASQALELRLRQSREEMIPGLAVEKLHRGAIITP